MRTWTSVACGLLFGFALMGSAGAAPPIVVEASALKVGAVAPVVAAAPTKGTWVLYFYRGHW